MSKLVSIVLPTYNRARLIQAAIESCLAQTYTDLEVIVVDDGSTDDTPDVVRQIAQRDGRVQYVRQDNAKLPAALNTGFLAARGELLTWTSDDNAYEPEAISLLVSYLREHPEVGLVYTDFQVVDADNQVLRVARRPPPSAIEEKNVVGACFMYRRSAAERVGEYDPQTFLAEDYDYWLRISRVAPVEHLAGVSPYRFRTHGESLSSLRGAEAELQAARVRARYAPTERERRARLAAGHRAAAAILRWNGHPGAALRHNLQAIRLTAGARAAYGDLALTCGAMLLQRRHGAREPRPCHAR